MTIYSPGAAAAASGFGAVAGDVITRVPPIEASSTNLLLQSAALGTAPWALTGGATVTANSTLAPNGILEADTINDQTGALGQAAQDVVIANDAGTYWFTCYLSFATSLQARFGLLLTGGAAVDSWVDLNPASGAAINSSGTFSVEAFSIEGVTWYRVAVKNTNNASGNVTARAYIQPASVSAATLGNVIAWGAQLEKRATPTQYIPTVTVQITRPNGVFPPWLVPVGGLVRIANFAFVAAANADITPGIDGAYTDYLIQVNSWFPSVDGGITAFFSDDNGASYKNGAFYQTQGSGVNNVGFLMKIGATVTAAFGWKGWVYLIEPFAAGTSKIVGFGNQAGLFSAVGTQPIQGDAGPGRSGFQRTTYYSNDTNNINAVRLTPTAGTVTASVTLFGVRLP